MRRQSTRLEDVLHEAIVTFQSQGNEAPAVEGALYDFEQMRSFFHEGQREAWEITSALLLLLCGRQSGKTIFGPWWLLREIQRRGPGDYAIVVPNYPLGRRKVLPYSEQILCRALGLFEFNRSEMCFRMRREQMHLIFGTSSPSELYDRYHLTDEDGNPEPYELYPDEVNIYVLSAEDPSRLESMTLNAAWFDECGQPAVPVTSHEALQGRVAVRKGKLLYTTTPYQFNWLKVRVWDRAIPQGHIPGLSIVEGSNADFACVRFESWMNPTFGRKQFERIRNSGMPADRFDMFYRGIWTRPAGRILQAWTKERNEIPRFAVPLHWSRIWGIDFGERNAAACKVAIDPTRVMAVVYLSYHPARHKAVHEHVATLRAGEPQRENSQPYCAGGAPSEDEWRTQFTYCGLPVARPSVKDHWTRILILQTLIQSGRLVVFGDLTMLIAEIENYQYELDLDGNVTSKILNKSSYHRLDCLLYIAEEIRRALIALLEERNQEIPDELTAYDISDLLDESAIDPAA